MGREITVTWVMRHLHQARARAQRQGHAEWMGRRPRPFLLPDLCGLVQRPSFRARLTRDMTGKTWGKHCDLGNCPALATIHAWEDQAARKGWTHVCEKHRGGRVETRRDRKMWKRSTLNTG